MKDKRRHHEEEAPPAPESQGDGAPSPDETATTASAPESPAAATEEPAVDEQRDKYLRLAAEYDNYRRRTAKERTEASARGQAELVARLVDALDDLARFAHIDPASTDSQ